MAIRRAFVFGLDCASPELWFERFRDELPVVSSLRDSGTWGALHSVHPPITIPAWASMMSGRDPGELGLYGFRGRASRAARSARLHDAGDLAAPLLWDLTAPTGLRSAVVGFPPSYPARPIRGRMITGMLTPDDAEVWTHPPELRAQVERWAGDTRYAFDTSAHRADDPDRLCEEVFDMTRVRFRVLRELLALGEWELGFVHEIGLDRLQHAFWDALDTDGAPGLEVLRDYHRLLDREIGETLDLLPRDCAVLVVSDHGARRLEGSFCLNAWLEAEGYLVLARSPERGRPPREADVDWDRTRAWADGGYCGRIYLNVQGRETHGALSPEDAPAVRDEIRERLEALRGPAGEPLGNAVHVPHEVYSHARGVAPDLLLYPGDLAWRCSESLGHDDLFLSGTDAGADVANHDWEGLFVLNDPERPGAGRHDGAHLLDVAPTLLDRLGVTPPGWMRGEVLP